MRTAWKLILWTGLLIVAVRVSLFVQSNGLEFNNYQPYILQAYQAIRTRLPF